MSWTITEKPLKDLIKELTAEEMPSPNYRNVCLAHTLRGMVLWNIQSIQERANAQAEWQETSRVIACYLLKREAFQKYGMGAGYNGMTESMGPSEVSCPLSYLDRVPQVTNPDWREKVRAYHAARHKFQSLQDGVRIRTARPLFFRDGLEEQEFVVRRKGGRIRLEAYTHFFMAKMPQNLLDEVGYEIVSA